MSARDRARARSIGVGLAAAIALTAAIALAAAGESAAADAAAAPAGPPRALTARIDAGGTHTCAVLDDGTLRCWGPGDRGQLGYGNVETIGDDETPAAAGPVALGAGRSALAVTAGGFHTCAVLDDGAVRCWGDGDDGRLGYGNIEPIGDDETPAAAGPVALGAGRSAVAVSAGFFHTCAVLDDATVRCWGSAESGQLGYGNIETIGDDETPAAAGPVALGAGRTAVAISVGEEHSCALLDDATVRCWGFGEDGRLGYGSPVSIGDDETPATAGPVDLGLDRTAVAISAGQEHTCALLDDATVRCWGENGDGQLGYGDTDDVGDDETPATAGPVDLGAGRTAVAISAGLAHTCAVLDDASIRCWGFGGSGQLGYGNTETIGDDEAPTTAGPVSLGGGSGAIAVATASDHTCASLSDGTLRCWGFGEDGRLGYAARDTIGDNETPAALGPVMVGGLVSPPPSLVPPPPVPLPTAPPDGDGYTPVAPVRVLDTRTGLGAPLGPLAAETALALAVPGPPAGATAAVLNVTVTEPDRAGFLTVFPCGQARPNASNLNFEMGENRPNLVVATIGASGHVCFAGNADTHVVADLSGWFAPHGSTNALYNPLVPQRLLDTRVAGPLTPASLLTLPVIGGAVPAGATALMLNVTAVDAAASGFLTVWPCGQPQPNVSNVNYIAGQIVPNAVAVKIGAGGTVCIASSAPASVVVDRVGWFGATGSPFESRAPTRVLDTRQGTGAPAGKLTAETTLVLTVPGPPTGATGVVLNVTATEPDAAGFVTVWPCGQPRPLASSLNVAADQLSAANLVA